MGIDELQELKARLGNPDTRMEVTVDNIYDLPWLVDCAIGFIRLKNRLSAVENNQRELLEVWNELKQ